MEGSGAARRKDRLPLAQRYDAALVDLDGVVYVGADPVPRAADALRAAAGQGMRICYVTNNASRTPAAVAEQLRRFDHDVSVDDIATSAQAVATVLRDRLPSGARVLAVGGEGLRAAVADSGFALVASAEQKPAAVAQGYSVDTTYDDLAQASLAIHSGALWVASNADPTMPSPRGLLPGNGALLAAVRAATATDPLIAGKPELALHREAIARTASRTPLVVGDRLDTDILGAFRAGVDSLLVLTGVTTPNELRSAPEDCRPTYVAADLGGLLQPLRPVRAYGERWSDAALAALARARERDEAAAGRPGPLRP